MAYRTILAAASGGSASDGAVELACRCARDLAAHVEAFHVRADPRNVLAYGGADFGGPAAGEFIDRLGADAAAIANRTKASFEAIVAQHQIPQGSAPAAGTPAASAAWREEVGHAPALVSRRARFFDLVVLGRSDRIVDHPHTDVVEQTLIGSGRPVLLAPATPPAKIGETIAVGWNDSVQATRAIAASLPLFAKARSVFVVTAGDRHRDSVPALIEYLAWQGIKARDVHVTLVGGVGPGEQLLSSARDEGADLLVMGGYGQTPWREFLFGGATREIVGASLLPVLLAN